jgi:hypothetical protein
MHSYSLRVTNYCLLRKKQAYGITHVSVCVRALVCVCVCACMHVFVCARVYP